MTNIRHGDPARSYGRGCRCDACRAKHAARVYRQRAARLLARVRVDGRMVAVNAPKHGTAATYNNWFCRCEACTAAWAKTHRMQDADRRERGQDDQKK